MSTADESAGHGEGRPVGALAFFHAEEVGAVGRGLAVGALRRLEERRAERRRSLPREMSTGALAVRGVHGDVESGVANGVTR